jgi:hypothetical protein
VGSFVALAGSFVASRVRSRVRSRVFRPKTRIPCAITNAYGASSGEDYDKLTRIAAHRPGRWRIERRMMARQMRHDSPVRVQAYSHP